MLSMIIAIKWKKHINNFSLPMALHMNEIKIQSRQLFRNHSLFMPSHNDLDNLFAIPFVDDNIECSGSRQTEMPPLPGS